MSLPHKSQAPVNQVKLQSLPTWQQERLKAKQVTKPRSTLRPESKAPTARARRREDRKTKAQVIEEYGRRCIGSFLGPCIGPIEDMHIRTKGAHPEIRHDQANHLPGCRWHHRMAPNNFTSTPELTQALWTAGELMARAQADNRLPPSFEELQAEVERAYGLSAPSCPGQERMPDRLS